jgi:hypothetical protein
MNTNIFAAKMSRLHNEELAEIAGADADQGYHAEAISAAKEELMRRNIDTAEMSRIQIQTKKSNEKTNERPYENLPLNRKIIIGLIAPIFFIFSVVFILARYQVQGYKKKSKDAFKAMFLGYMFWFFIGFSFFIVTDLIS